jgi:hypothetical protein
MILPLEQQGKLALMKVGHWACIQSIQIFEAWALAWAIAVTVYTSGGESECTECTLAVLIIELVWPMYAGIICMIGVIISCKYLCVACSDLFPEQATQSSPLALLQSRPLTPLQSPPLSLLHPHTTPACPFLLMVTRGCPLHHPQPDPWPLQVNAATLYVHAR